MRIALAADHAGVGLKRYIMEQLVAGHIQLDVGGDGSDPHDDYPDFARSICAAVRSGQAEVGILVCGSGVGAAMACNKLHGIRAALCHDTYSARQSREDDNANVLCLGARVIGAALAMEIVNTWLAAAFSGAERHRRRLAKLAELERDGKP